MEDDRLGRRAATAYWSNHFSLARFAARAACTERRGGGVAECFEEWFGVFVWSTRSESGRNGFGWFRSRVSGAAGGDLFCCVHRHALSLARVAGVRATLRAPLSSDDED